MKDVIKVRGLAAASMSLRGISHRAIAELTLDDVDFEPSGFTLTVRGKGGRVRQVTMSGEHASALASWLDVRGLKPGPLIVKLNPHAEVIEPLTPVGTYAVQGCIKTAHGHRFAPEMKKCAQTRQYLGLSVREVARIMGTSAGYLCDVENGSRVPTELLLSRYAAALHESATQMIADADAGAVGHEERIAWLQRIADAYRSTHIGIGSRPE